LLGELGCNLSFALEGLEQCYLELFGMVLEASLQVRLSHGGRDLLLEGELKLSLESLKLALGLAAADVSPAALDRWDRTRVECANVLLGKMDEGSSVHGLAVDLLGLHGVQDLLSKSQNLLNELWS